MKNLWNEFKSSIFDKETYRNISQKSLKNVFKYINKVSLVIATITLVEVAVYLAFLQMEGQLLGTDMDSVSVVITWIIALVGTFITVLISSIIFLIIYGFIIGIFVLIIMKVTKRNYNYTQSVKAGIYSCSLSAVLIGVNFPIKLEALSLAAMFIPILILAINLRIPKVSNPKTL